MIEQKNFKISKTRFKKEIKEYRDRYLEATGDEKKLLDEGFNSFSTICLHAIKRFKEIHTVQPPDPAYYFCNFLKDLIDDEEDFNRENK